MPLSLYIHIPFCLKRCIYCDFVSGIYDPDKAALYIEALKKEISQIPSAAEFSTLYIGGGTPTSLSTDLLKDFIGHIFTTLAFTDDCEATIEANPGTLDPEKLKALKNAGMNRISIGVQSFNDDELKLLGRQHTSDDAVKAVALSREAGFSNIGIDLIYGIPGQNIESWRRSIETAVSLDPEHISAYELTVEKGTSLYESVSNGDLLTLDDDLIEEMYFQTIDLLASSGFEHYEISNFAKPGYRSRHNLNYWDRGEYYGAGLGAHSFVSGKRGANTGDLNEYIDIMTGDADISVDSEIVTAEKAVEEAIFLGLRKTEGIDINLFKERYGIYIPDHYADDIKELIELGLIDISDSVIRLTRKGLLLSNEVFVRLI